MSKQMIDAGSQSTPDLVTVAAFAGGVAAGVALFEVALIPGMALGAVAVLAPGLVSRRLPKLRRGLRSLFGATDPPADRPGFAIKQALAKTITYRTIVTTLDFTWNYVILGDAAAAAGLSAISLAVGPLFYFVHETAWNYFGARAANRPLAKTIVFRTLATTTEFTTNYVIVGDLATAAMLSAFGFAVGPFVYLGHEMAWDYYGGRSRPAIRLTAQEAPA